MLLDQIWRQMPDRERGEGQQDLFGIREKLGDGGELGHETVAPEERNVRRRTIDQSNRLL